MDRCATDSRPIFHRQWTDIPQTIDTPHISRVLTGILAMYQLVYWSTCWPTCQSKCRPIHRLAYWLSVVQQSPDMAIESWPILMVNILADSANWYSMEGYKNYTRSLKLITYTLFLSFTLQGCALGNTEGSLVVWTCEMPFMKKLKFSSHPIVIGVRGRQVLLEHILMYCILFWFFFIPNRHKCQSRSIQAQKRSWIQV